MRNKISAFTLIELMIAAALGLILLGMIGYTMNNTSKAVNSTQAQVALHNRGRAIMDRMMRELESVRMDSSYNNNITIDSILPDTSIQFLTSAPSLTVSDGAGGTTTLTQDLIWVKYTWNSSKKILYRDWKEANINDLATTTIDGSNRVVFDYNVTQFNPYNEVKTIQVDLTLTDSKSSLTRNLGFAVVVPGK